jgi:hypothetical protein
MKSTVFWALIVLNAALLLSFVWRVMPANTAHAQQRGAAATPQRAGDYLVINAEVSGGSNGILVILDQANAQLSAVGYDDSNHKVEPMGKIDLRQALQGGGAAPARGRAGARTGY